MVTSEENLVLDFQTLHNLEWIEANGLGGFSSGTFSGAHSRKYHGLLVAAMQPPVKRVVVVSKLEETIITAKGSFNLSCNQFPGALHPRGFQYLTSYKHDLFPQWIYHVNGITLSKTVAMIHGENTTVVLYEVLEAPEKFSMQLQPFYASRDMHELARANDYIGLHYLFNRGIFQTMNYQGCPEFFISVPRSQFVEGRVWYYNFEYQQEYVRGMDFREDLFSHGRFEVTLRKGSRLGIIVSLENPSGRDAWKLFRQERRRREAVAKPFDHPGLASLALAADQFVVKRNDSKTIIAGYPWFTDWGRDTMIALPGLCLVTGQIREARKILQMFADHVSDGMIPNRFPDVGHDPEYNSIDASLWFFYAVYKYYKYSSDKVFVKGILPLLRDMIDWHYRGTRYGIHVDKHDELLMGGDPATQLTWMDAKVGEWPVTSRWGKPVEVNALWYNALCVTAFLHDELNYHEDAADFTLKAEDVRRSFNNVFWNEDLGYLYDCIQDNHPVTEVRPNQLYAVSLPFPVLYQSRAGRMMELVHDHLLTPYGVRSLSPQHPAFRARYEGGPDQRDASCHQGPAWSHLLGPFIDGLFYAMDDEARGLATELVENMFQHLHDGCVGTVSEIFDGDPPYSPGGGIAQAWSVGELLRVATEYDLFSNRSRALGSKVIETVGLNGI